MNCKTISTTTQEIQDRFFEAMNELIAQEKISMRYFCRKYDLNRIKYLRLKAGNRGYKVIDIDALTYLSKDYNVSAEWLLTGDGNMFKQPLTL
jgi:transcriptional regulator with XRE-family HTH domain